MNLKGFEAYDMHDRPIAFSITENGVTFNASVTKAIGEPEYAVLYINPTERLIVLKASSKINRTSKVYMSKKKREKTVKSVRWSSEKLNRDIINLIEGENAQNYCLCGYKVFGKIVYIDEDQKEPAVLFDLKNAKQIQW